MVVIINAEDQLKTDEIGIFLCEVLLYMKCKECGKVFDKKDNQAVRISGEKIMVCPNCGHEEVMKQKKNSK